jgi:hypothetical protein
MSTPHSDNPEVPPRQDEPSGEDGINIRYIVAVGLVSLAVFAASTVVAWLIMKADLPEENSPEVAPAPALLKAPEIGLVDIPMFDDDGRLEEWKAAKAKRLASYGWVDKGKGVAHIPIEKAMEQVITQAASAPPPGNRR